MNNSEQVTVDTAELPQNGQKRPAQLSSNSTLFWRVFVPVFFTVFFSGLLLAFWLTDADELYIDSMPVMIARAVVTFFWLGWLYFVWKTIWRLKRVDADDAHFFVTNYWKTARYPWEDLKKIEEKKRLGKRIVNFHLKAPGIFGQIISFLPGSSYEEWMTENGKAKAPVFEN